MSEALANSIILAMEQEIANLRGALAFIHNSTEEGAIKHRDYDSLAISVYTVAKEALDGKFVDDMHAAEVYDRLHPRPLPPSEGAKTP